MVVCGLRESETLCRDVCDGVTRDPLLLLRFFYSCPTQTELRSVRQYSNWVGRTIMIIRLFAVYSTSIH